MTTQALGWWLFGIQSVAYVMLCWILPFRWVLRSGRFWRGVMICWFTAAAFSICSALLGQYLYRKVDKALVDYCFDGMQAMGFVFVGWWQGMIISGVALVIYRARRNGQAQTPRTSDMVR